MMTASFKRTAPWIVWLVAITTGLAIALNYENTAGRTGETPEHWPANMPMTLDARRDTLVLFAHPQCPCTRASLEELNRLLARCQRQVTAHVFFFKPDHSPDDWTRTDLWRSAAAMPGVTVHEDTNNTLAERFGAETSGFVVLYDPQGQLRFKGGITGSRGHAGDNAGESTIASLLAGQNAALKQTPVYGCSLFSKICSTTTSGGGR